MEDKKYILTDETLEHDGRTLYRIQAIKDFNSIKKGELGGFIQSERNLSQFGGCWIYHDAMVYDKALVTDNAMIFGIAEVFEEARIVDDSLVSGNAKVYGAALICNKASVQSSAQVYDTAIIKCKSIVSDFAKVYGNAVLNEKAVVYNLAKIYGNAHLCNAVVQGAAKVYGNAELFDRVVVEGQAEIFGNAKIAGKVSIGGNARIKQSSDYIVFKNWWSSGRYFVWTRSNDKYRVGCFYGSGEELIKKAYRDSDLSGQEYERIVNYVESIKKVQL